MFGALFLSIIIDSSFVDVIDADYILEDELILETEVTVGEEGKNVVFYDACICDDALYIVGGAVRYADYGGMDGLVLKYNNKRIEWLEVFGGSKTDLFKSIQCGEQILAFGESSSIDYDLYGNDTSNYKSLFTVALDSSGNKLWSHFYRDKFDLVVTNSDGYYITGTDDHISNKVAFVGKYSSEGVFAYNEYPLDSPVTIHDILVRDKVYLVGSSMSGEVLGQRGIVIEIDKEVNTYHDTRGEISFFNSIEYIDDIYITGVENLHEMQTHGDSRGFYGMYNSEFDLIKYDFNIIKQYDGNHYGMDYDKGYKIRLSNKEVDIEGTLVKVLDEYIVYTTNDTVKQGKIMCLETISYTDGLYYNNRLIDLETKFYDELTKSYGKYSTYDYAKFGDYEFFGNFQEFEVMPYTNIDKDEYYNEVTIFFYGGATLNGVEIESPYILTEVGNYELMLLGEEPISKYFSLLEHSPEYEYPIDTPNVEYENDYSYLLLAIPIILLWLKLRK